MLLLTSALWTLDWWGAFTRHDELDFDRGIWNDPHTCLDLLRWVQGPFFLLDLSPCDFSGLAFFNSLCLISCLHALMGAIPAYKLANFRTILLDNCPNCVTFPSYNCSVLLRAAPIPLITTIIVLIYCLRPLRSLLEPARQNRAHFQNHMYCCNHENWAQIALVILR